jgi:hypothetical protein
MLQAKAVATNDRWTPVLAAAGLPADWNVGIVNYALAYQMTANINYAQKAWDLMQESMGAGLAQVSSPLPVEFAHPAIGTPTGTSEVSGDSGYQARNYFPAACVCLDWLSPWLSSAQRSTLIADIETCADWIWPETTPSRKGAWGVDDPGSNYYQSFMFTWLAGLALFGESGKAQGYLDNARRRWDTEVAPYLNSLARGGVWPEGLGYGTGSTGFLLWYLLAHQSATGEDLIGATPWCTDAVTAMLQFTTPSLTEKAPIGDLAAGPLNDYARRVMLAMSGHDGRCAAWLNRISPARNLQVLTRWEEFLWAPPTGIGPPPEPTFFRAPGIGLISSRTDWTPAATQLLAVAGLTTESHQDRAQGAFMLYRNGWQAATAKLGSHSGLDQDAADYCCLTVGAQPQTWTQNTVVILAQEDTPVYTHLVFDLAGAYAGQLSRYQRELFFVKAGSTLLVRDIYTPVDPTTPVTAHLSTPAVALQDAAGPLGERTFKAGCLFGMVLSPPGRLPAFSTAQNDPLDTPSYRIDLLGDAQNEIAVALEAGAPGQAARTLTGMVLGTGVKAVAAPGMLAGWVSGAGPWSYRSPSAGAQYLLGVKPNTAYAAGAFMAQSSVSGLLSFMAAAGPVTISEAGITPPPPPPPPPPKTRTFAISVPPGGAPTITETTP